MVRESRASHVVVNRFAIHRGKPRGAVWQQASTLRLADRLTKVGLRVQTVFTLATFRCVKRDHVIANFQAGNTFANFNNNASTLMAQNRRKQPFGIITRTRKFVRVANTCGFDLHQNLTRLGAFKVNIYDLKRFPSCKGNCCTCDHYMLPDFDCFKFDATYYCANFD